MIEVACPSCQAPYELDERRLPAGGLRMRCPKCGHSFGVTPDGSVDAAEGSGGARAPKKTQAGVGPPPPPPSGGGGQGKIAPPVPQPPTPGRREGTEGKGKIAPPVPQPPTPARPQPPAPPTPAPPTDASDEADLPALKGGARGERKLATPFDEWDADLPAPKGSTATGSDEGGIDLPVAKGGGSQRGDDLDLPAPAARKPGESPRDEADFGDLDLPMPKGAADRAASGGRGERGVDELDLPAPKPETPGGGLDELDLPMTKGQGDLPAPANDRADLPVTKGQGDLPAPRSEPPFEEEDLELGEEAGAVGRRGPSERSEREGDPAGVGLGEKDLPGLDEDELPLPEPRPRGAAAGEAASEAAGAGPAESAPVEGALEFDAIPEEGAEPDGAVPEVDVSGAAPRARPSPRDSVSAPGGPQKPKIVRTAVVTGAVLLVLVGAGVGLGFTPHGYFGMYFFERFLPSAGEPAQVRQAIEEASRAAAPDTRSGGHEALRILAAERREAGLNRELLSRSLLAESLFQVRFGDLPASASRAAAIASRLEKRGFAAPHAHLARAAHALAQGELDEAETLLDEARGPSSGHPLFPVLEGELALAQGRPERAVKAFRRAAEDGLGARALWGLARAHWAAGDEDAYRQALEATLEASPGHAAARVAKGHRAFVEGDMDAAERLAREAVGARPVEGEALKPARETRAAGWTLLGRVYERGGRRGEARAAYERALEADPYRVGAQIGAGQVLLAERQYRDALSRFRAALDALEEDEGGTHVGTEASPRIAAEVGVVRALLALDREQDARATTDRLLQEYPEDPHVLLWAGKTAQATDDMQTAQQRFREVIEQTPEQFLGYLALAQLFFDRDRPSDATAVLERAQENVPETAQMRRMLGESKLRRGRPEEAIEEFERALELDADDTAARFGIGVAHRRAGRFEAAMETFEEVAARDSSFPGLAVQRGRIYEAQGQAERAVENYRAALEQRSEDLDLMIRLGAALIGAGRVEQAQEVLDKVMRERPHSAEGEYLMGRVAFARGDVQEALARLRRAVQLDSTRGEYHMYLARALFEQGSLAKAFEAVEEALDRDRDLADAYWVRGRLRLRSGAVKDALDDLKKALELDPQRYEAYAAMGDSYDQLGKRREAIDSYEKAIEHDNSRGEWWYRLGRLRLDTGQRRGAAKAMARATVLGDAMDVPPGWLADAHRLQADLLRAQGKRDEAVEHYRRYLEIAPQEAIDRQEVRRKLLDLGAAP